MRTRFFAATAALSLAGASAAMAEPFTFVALGDMPYGQPEEVFPAFETLIETINRRAPAFTVHIGDTKSGGTPCSDEMLKAQLDYLNSFESAVVYTPGDNEWTDCHREPAGAFDPLERLAHIRATYFDQPSISFGQKPIDVESQAVVMADAYAGFPENVRFARDEVYFVTAHVVGSNNNLEVRDADAALEFFARDTANVAWLADSFDQAAALDAKALVLAIHADMFDSGFGGDGFVRHSGFKNFGDALVAKAAAFGRPVLLIFGDSHVFRVFRPFPDSAGNVVALEVFGADDMHAVEVSVDPDDPAVFGFRPLLNPALDTAG